MRYLTHTNRKIKHSEHIVPRYDVSFTVWRAYRKKTKTKGPAKTKLPRFSTLAKAPSEVSVYTEKHKVYNKAISCNYNKMHKNNI